MFKLTAFFFKKRVKSPISFFLCMSNPRPIVCLCGSVYLCVMCVCLCLCLSARISPEPHARSLRNFVHVVSFGMFTISRIVYRREGVFFLQRAAMLALQSAVLAIAIPSVCLSVCMSVTRRYCVKTTAHSTVQFALSDSKMCLVL